MNFGDNLARYGYPYGYSDDGQRADHIVEQLHGSRPMLTERGHSLDACPDEIMASVHSRAHNAREPLNNDQLSRVSSDDQCLLFPAQAVIE